MKKIGIIEIKSDHSKLTIAEIENGFFRIVDEIEDNIKLGEDINKDGFLKPSRISEVISILSGYKKLCTAKEIAEVTVVATYAVRNAKNQKSFVDEISAMLGFKVKVLTEDEEIGAIYTSIVNTLDVPKGVLISVDSENVSVAMYVRRNILFEKTIPFGTATIINSNEGKEISNIMQVAYDDFKDIFSGMDEIKSLEPDFQLVGAGESFESIGKLAKNLKKYSLDLVHGLTLQQKDVEAVYNFVSGLDLDKRSKLRGISEGRADIVAIAVAVVKALSDTVNLENILVSTNNITTGLLLNEANVGTLEKPITDILGYSLDSQANFNHKTKSNSEQVYNLAMILFKQLRVLHKLPRTYIKSLRVASFMHDSGLRINHNNHEKNSFNIILNESIFGLTHRELLVASFISSSQNASDFSIAEFARFRDILTEEDLDAIKKLAVIVRIAEAFDRCHNSTIKDVNCDILGDSVILKAVSDGDAAFEIREAMTASQDFFRAYRKNIEIL